VSAHAAGFVPYLDNMHPGARRQLTPLVIVRCGRHRILAVSTDYIQLDPSGKGSVPYPDQYALYGETPRALHAAWVLAGGMFTPIVAMQGAPSPALTYGCPAHRNGHRISAEKLRHEVREARRTGRTRNAHAERVCYSL